MNRFFCFIGCLLLLFMVACGAPKVVEETKKDFSTLFLFG